MGANDSPPRERAWRVVQCAIVGVIAFAAGFALCIEFADATPPASIKTVIADDHVHVWEITLPQGYRDYQAYLESQEAPFPNSGADEVLVFPAFDDVPWRCVTDFNVPGAQEPDRGRDLKSVSFRIALCVKHRVDIIDERLEGKSREEIWKVLEDFKTPIEYATIGSDGGVRRKARERIAGTLYNIYNLNAPSESGLSHYSAVTIPNPELYEDGEELVLWMNQGLLKGKRAVRYRVRYAPVSTALPTEID